MANSHCLADKDQNKVLEYGISGIRKEGIIQHIQLWPVNNFASIFANDDQPPQSF